LISAVAAYATTWKSIATTTTRARMISAQMPFAPIHRKIAAMETRVPMTTALAGSASIRVLSASMVIPALQMNA
jgi:hypothetical protein